jgi:hypothetical protein
MSSRKTWQDAYPTFRGCVEGRGEAPTTPPHPRKEQGDGFRALVEEARFIIENLDVGETSEPFEWCIRAAAALESEEADLRTKIERLEHLAEGMSAEIASWRSSRGEPRMATVVLREYREQWGVQS